MASVGVPCCSGYAIILFLVRANALRLRTSGPFMDRFGAHLSLQPLAIVFVPIRLSVLRAAAVPALFVYVCAQSHLMKSEHTQMDRRCSCCVFWRH